jgi:methionyl-tRNA formyltransferase
MCETKFRPAVVVTRKERGPYPYFPVTQLDEEVRRLKNVRCVYGFEPISGEEFDLLVVATYHRLISSSICQNFQRCVNVHPSLLPSYKGPNPFFWIIKNGEHRAGVTIHELDSELDSGDIWSQKKIDLDADETQGSLRLKLAKIAADLVAETLHAIESQKLVSTKPQGRENESYFKRPEDKDCEVDFDNSAVDAVQTIRSIIPHPGYFFDFREVLNAYVENRGCGDFTAGSIVEKSDECIIVSARDANIRLVTKAN